MENFFVHKIIFCLSINENENETEKYSMIGWINQWINQSIYRQLIQADIKAISYTTATENKVTKMIESRRENSGKKLSASQLSEWAKNAE